MSWTVTFHAWWLLIWLLLGALLVVPLNVIAWRTLARPRPSLHDYLRPRYEDGRRSWRFVVAVTARIVLWPVAVWEVLS